MAKRTKNPKTQPEQPRDSATIRERLEVENPRLRKAAEAERPETVARWAQDAAQPREWSWPSQRRLIGQRIPRPRRSVEGNGTRDLLL